MLADNWMIPLFQLRTRGSRCTLHTSRIYTQQRIIPAYRLQPKSTSTPRGLRQSGERLAILPIPSEPRMIAALRSPSHGWRHCALVSEGASGHVSRSQYHEPGRRIWLRVLSRLPERIRFPSISRLADIAPAESL